MRFEDPLIVIYVFWSIPIIIFFWIFFISRKRVCMRSFVSSSLWHEIASSFSMRREYVKIAFLSLSILLIFGALARPQMGFQWKEVKRKGLDIIFAIDTSRSMLAQDMSPSRLERTKMAVGHMLKQLTGDRIGLIVFSGEAFLQCPITLDYEGFRVSLSDIDTDYISRGGTSISEAIMEAVRSYEPGQRKYKVLILVSDGEDLEGDALKAAHIAKEENIKIFCIGVGSKGGSLLLISDANGNKTRIEDRNGQKVISRLNEKLLKEVAFITGGAYIHSSGTDFGLMTIYKDKISIMDKRDIGGKMHKQYNEKFQIPLLLAIFLLIIEPCISNRRS